MGTVAEVTTNGKAQAPPEGELGSVLDRAGRLFVSYDEGSVFTQPDFEAQKVDAMLRRDGQAQKLEQVLTLPLRQAPWSIEPKDGDRGEAMFATDVLTLSEPEGGMSTPLDLVIAQMTGACLYRRTYFEKVFRVEDGQVVYDKIAWRPPSTCKVRYDEQSGAFQGIRQWAWRGDGIEEVDIPVVKSLVVVNGQHRRPLEGVSDLETALSLYETKQKIRFLWASFLENQTMPKALAKDSTSDPASVQQFARKVATLKGGGVVGLGQDQSVEPFETSNSAGAVFEAAMRYLDSEMAGSVLAGFTDLTTQARGGQGSRALSQDASGFFLMSRQAVLTELATVVTNRLVAPIVGFNFANPRIPQFKFGSLTPEDAQATVSLLQAIAATPAGPLVPKVFIDLLCEKVATLLDLDVDQVHKAITDQVPTVAAQAAQPGGLSPDAQSLVTGAHAAAHLVAAAGLGAGAQPGTPPAQAA
jgi:hypothetical protein